MHFRNSRLLIAFTRHSQYDHSAKRDMFKGGEEIDCADGANCKSTDYEHFRLLKQCAFDRLFIAAISINC